MLVALSGYGRDEDKHRALEAGFDAHMTKPVDRHHVESLLLEVAGVRPGGERSRTLH